MNTPAKESVEYLLSNVNFLLLEDTLTLRAWLIHEMRSFGFKGAIHEASTIAEADQILRLQPIDFIISDWNLPDGSGLKFLESVKRDLLYMETPFLMWTTVNESSKIIDAIATGAHEYLIKPCKREDAFNKIVNLWKKKNAPIKKR